MEPNALTVIHKYIRRMLFDVSLRISSAGPEDAAAVNEAVREAAGILRGHGQHEEAMFGPLLEDLEAGASRRLSDDHARLDGQLDALCQTAGALAEGAGGDAEAALGALHLDWNRFVAAYLEHLDDEERSLFVPLLEHIPPVELVAASIASMPEVEATAFLAQLWRVTTPQERGRIEQARGRHAEAPADTSPATATT